MNKVRSMTVTKVLPLIMHASAEILMACKNEKVLSVAAMLRRSYKSQPLKGTAHMHVHWLQTATSIMEDAPLAQILSSSGHLLPWHSTDPRLPPFVELLGPDGMLIANEFRFGLYLQPPHFFYPPHNHSAEEYYYLLGGKVDWQMDDEVFAFTSPKLVHHKPWQRHAMRTGSGPLLALWIWLGDIRYSTYSIDPN